MTVIIGSIPNKFDALDYFHQSVLNSLEKSIKNKKDFPTSRLKLALNDLKVNKEKFGNKKSTKMEDLYNDAQQYIINKELNSRSKK